MIKPTIGRIVWYYPDAQDVQQGGFTAGQEQPGIVCRVWGDTCVNLQVVTQDGGSTARTSVPLVQPGEAVLQDHHYATWMPFQIGAAKQYEAEQAAKKEAAS
jgi:hypothetical protein